MFTSCRSDIASSYRYDVMTYLDGAAALTNLLASTTSLSNGKLQFTTDGLDPGTRYVVTVYGCTASSTAEREVGSCSDAATSASVGVGE